MSAVAMSAAASPRCVGKMHGKPARSPMRSRSHPSVPRRQTGALRAAKDEHYGYAPRVRSRVPEIVTDDGTTSITTTASHAKLAFSALAATAGGNPSGAAYAAQSSSPTIDPFFNFNPVCPASDGVFRVGQKAALGLAGADNIENYRPLINDVLIRVRTELCVLESFSRETALPFIREKGLGWVLPLHETSETYLAGVVFMVGANFILLGSTKVVAILAIYHDLSVGLICRGAGGLLGMATPEADAETREREFSKLADEQMSEMKAIMMDSSMDKTTRETKTAEINKRYASLMEDTKSAADIRVENAQSSPLATVRQAAGTVAVPLRLYGRASKILRQGLEVFDTFCSRYFVAFTVTYIIVKTTHYVLFPNIFD